MKKYFFIAASFVISLVFFGFWFFLRSPLFLSLPPESPRIFDTRDTLLFWGLSENDEYFWKIPFSEISPHFVVAATLAEDARFWEHGGFDGLSMIRALGQNLLSGSVVSGASTLTQQVAKNILDNPPRTIPQKIRELFVALHLEAQLSKEEIFASWANRASFSGNIRGVEAASRLFFNVPAHSLTPAQAAFLAAIPQNPSRKMNQIQVRQQRILEKMQKEGFLTSAEFDAAITEEIPNNRFFPQNLAPHFSQFLQEQFPDETDFHSSLDLRLQQKAEQILRGNLKILSAHNAGNAAILAFENATGAIKIWIGSADFSNASLDGEVDVLRSFRQVGSTLKPFLYLRAFQKMNWSSETEILDEPRNFPVDFGNFFEPKNYDLDFRGVLTVRSAIAESRNVPAVSTLEQIGVSDFVAFLRGLGADFLSDMPEDYGLGIALGSAEMRLMSLAKIYGILARNGQDFELCSSKNCPIQDGREFLNKNIVLEMTDILSDNSARVPSFSENSALSFSFPVAAKTGTTRNFDDNFVVGYTPDFTVLVWVGNADGASMNGVSGISGAGPIFHDVVSLLAEEYLPRSFEKPLPPPPNLPSPTEPHLETPKKENPSFSSLRILSPLSGSRFTIDVSRPISAQKIAFETSTSAEFFLDGEQIFSGTRFLWIPEKGRHLLRVEAMGESMESEFWVE